MDASEVASADDLPEEAPRVGTVLINFNSLDDLSRCIESLLTLQYGNHLIICVDNCSTDGSRE